MRGNKMEKDLEVRTGSHLNYPYKNYKGLNQHMGIRARKEGNVLVFAGQGEPEWN